jgi:hypothetical protein
MSACSALTREEFCACFPTIEDLKHLFVVAGRSVNWGLCQNVLEKTRTSFCLADSDWELVCALPAIAKYAGEHHNEVPLDSLRFCHEVDVQTLVVNYWLFDERDAHDRVLDAQQALTQVLRKGHTIRVLH